MTYQTDGVMASSHGTHLLWVAVKDKSSIFRSHHEVFFVVVVFKLFS